MIVVDTSVWIDFFADRRSAEVTYLSSCLDVGLEDVFLTDIVLTEVLQGLRTERDVHRVEQHLSPFGVLRLTDLSDFRHAAQLYRQARRKGVTIRRTNDCLIAALCIREGIPLLHRDVDFDRLATVSALEIARCQPRESESHPPTPSR